MVMLTVKDVANRLRISQTTVYRMIQSGDLKAIRIGAGFRFRIEEEALQQFIDRNRTE